MPNCTTPIIRTTAVPTGDAIAGPTRGNQGGFRLSYLQAASELQPGQWTEVPAGSSCLDCKVRNGVQTNISSNKRRNKLPSDLRTFTRCHPETKAYSIVIYRPHQGSDNSTA